MTSFVPEAPTCTGSQETIVEVGNLSSKLGDSLHISNPSDILSSESKEYDSLLTASYSQSYLSPSDTSICLTEPPTPSLQEVKSAESISKKSKTRGTVIVSPGEFEPEVHFYPRVLNATIHPLVASFFNLGNERILARYAHLNPSIDIEVLRQCLEYTPKHFCWAGELSCFLCYATVLNFIS
ncbi:hypothetical protein DSO57_1021667 [Entomophthora muscae]|uniref:Uncharacterized protein n=1 Tax=Entomophthora muscae TaxID=34485 RepID=A0ACC2T3H3_9FUNG|nr:hypothetical protein DSO57_1021667 [Entomophthora muscae]